MIGQLGQSGQMFLMQGHTNLHPDYAMALQQQRPGTTSASLAIPIPVTAAMPGRFPGRSVGTAPPPNSST